MAFHKGGRFRVAFCVGPRAANRQLLATNGGRINTRAFPVTARGYTRQDGVDSVAIALCIHQLFHDEHDAPFTNEHTLRVFVVGGHVLLRAEHGRFAKCHKHAQGAVRARGTSNHGVAVSVEKFLDSHFDRNQRTGAGCIDHTVHTSHVKHVAATTGGHVPQKAGKGVQSPLREVGLVFLHGRVHVILRHAQFIQHFFHDSVVEAGVKLVARLLATTNSQNAANVLFHFAARVNASIFQGLLHFQQG